MDEVKVKNKTLSCVVMHSDEGLPSLVHFASNLTLAIEWLKVNGNKWEDDDYYYEIFDRELDKSVYDFNITASLYFDKYANVIEVEDYPRKMF